MLRVLVGAILAYMALDPYNLRLTKSRPLSCTRDASERLSGRRILLRIALEFLGRNLPVDAEQKVGGSTHHLKLVCSVEPCVCEGRVTNSDRERR